MHRIQWFDRQIREGLHPNSGGLADQFEISRRQAQRDIEYLMFSLRAPLVYVAKHRGYTYEDKTYVLPQLFMTDDEKKLLKYLAFRYRQYSYEGGETISRLSYLLEQIGDEGETGRYKRMPFFEANPKLMQVVELITCAIEQRRVVELTYQDTERQTRLSIRPLQLVSRYATDYLAAYDERNRQKRMLRLDGIRQVRVTEESYSAETTEQCEWIDEGALIRKPYIAKLRLAESPGSGSWHGYKIRSVHEGVLDIEFYDADLFLQQLIVSDWQQVVAPKWLQAKLLSCCQNVLGRLSAGCAMEGSE
jgi:predicted DNA-binding transcriptional regulator YafY